MLYGEDMSSAKVKQTVIRRQRERDIPLLPNRFFNRSPSVNLQRIHFVVKDNKVKTRDLQSPS